MEQTIQKLDDIVTRQQLIILLLANLVMILLIVYTVGSWHTLFVDYQSREPSQFTPYESSPDLSERKVDTGPTLLTEADHERNHARLAQLSFESSLTVDSSVVAETSTTTNEPVLNQVTSEDHRIALTRLETLTAEANSVEVVEE